MSPRAGWLLVGVLVVSGFALGPLLLRVEPAAPAGCGSCHADPEPTHAQLGCERCHLGNPNTAVREVAHVGLVRLPGQLDDAARTCGAAGCHADAPARLANNVMTTMNGVVSVDRWVFGAQSTQTALTPLSSIGHGPADSHLRNLCASCHLDAKKTTAGPIDERTRGGGCLACHLEYGASAHPKVSGVVGSNACFGCHSRSGRISLNFEGWLDVGDADADAGSKTLQDGRHLQRVSADVHAAAGFTCVDCHGAAEVMGDGRLALHREDQRVIACADCHPEGAPNVYQGTLDALSQRVLARLPADAGSVVRSARTGVPLPGLFVVGGGVQVWVRGRSRLVDAPRSNVACSRQGLHGRLSCQSCHDAWVPTCISCHTRFDDGGVMFDLLAREEAAGSWEEQGGVAEALPPALGETADGGIVTVAPGMILTIDDRPLRRIFAPVAAHTTSRARTCVSCHVNPGALGFGRGVVKFTKTQGALEPSFDLSLPRASDGLPQDAWVAPWTASGASTREWLGPLSVPTQRRMVAVGACLSCHTDASAVLTGRPAGPRCLKFR
ncbi:MAG: hypothetical protein JNM69_17035 [Archangium sp.]|nr:hypothetical protein [Archangium sp.]